MIHKGNLTSFGDPQGSILVPLAGSYTGVRVKKKHNQTKKTPGSCWIDTNSSTNRCSCPQGEISLNFPSYDLLKRYLQQINAPL